MKTNKFKTLCLATLASLCCFMVSAQPNIIPKPTSEHYSNGKIELSGSTTVSYNQKDDSQAGIFDYLNEKVKPATNYAFKAVKSNGDIQLILNKKANLAKEGYNLNIDKEGIKIEASSNAGLFYGVQTLLQLMPSDIKSTEYVNNISLNVPYCSISDSPEFPWRGLMLDVSRHWFDKEDVKRYIDQLAEYKMNVFHWHLTDDQGWRIEIKSRPELTQKAALRAERVGQWWQREPQREGEEATYGGFYTQEDIKEVLAYAKERFVTVVPEIDVPGHSLAVLVAYPELACFKAPTSVNVGNKFYGIDENTLCVGNPETFKFMEDVLKEVSELFPSEYIHIGGDECWKGFWAKCPKCQEEKHEHGLETENELQSYFIRRMETILKSHGKKLIGWDEINEGGLAPEANVMSWRGMEGGIAAAKAGHHVVMTPNNHCYLDLYQGDSKIEPDTYSMCRLRDSYAFKPIPEGVSKDFILGGQGNLWSESVPTMRHAEYMTWPRAWALSEVLWSGQDNKNWNNFTKRVEAHFERADKAEINYARSLYDAIITPYQENGKVYISLEAEIENIDIYYTFDNTYPDKYSPKYTSPLTIPDGATWLKVITYRNGEKIGREITHTTEDLRNNSKGVAKPVGNLNL